MDALLSADVGGTTIGVGVVSASGEVRLAGETPTRPAAGAGGARGVVETLLSRLVEMQARAVSLGLAITGCGIGVAGTVDAAAGRIGVDVHNIPELAGCPLAELARRRTGLPTVLDNDVNALALGEARFGLGRGLRSLVVLALGTGVGGGVILDGEIVRGASGYGGELGHATVRFDGRPCFCGSRGCLNAYVAGPDIAARAREAGLARPGPRLAAVPPDTLTAREVFEAALAGDDLARALVDETCQALGAALGAILNGLNPEAIVLTGGVMGSLAVHLDRIRHWTRGYAFAGAYRAATIQVAPLTKTMAIRGAAALFLYEAGRRPRGTLP